MPNSFDVPNFAPLDVAFFNRILSEAGHTEAQVVDFNATPIGTGQMAECIRFDLQMSTTSEATPTSLVGKFASKSAASRAAAVRFASYAKEVAFYQQFLELLKIKTPTCFYADITEDTESFILLLSDLSPARQGDQLTGCTVAVARCAVLELVGLHAPTWNKQRLFSSHPLLQIKEAEKRAGQEVYANLMTPFAARFGDRLTADQLAIIRRAGESISPLFTAEVQPLSMIHGDYRLDNLLLTAKEAPEVYAVDWQTLTVGNPLADVAYMMATGLDASERRTVEKAIVHEYHQGLLAAGVTDFSWEDCWCEYRRMSVFGLPITVVASMMVERTERGDAMFLVMAAGCSQMALDLNAEEFLR